MLLCLLSDHLLLVVEFFPVRQDLLLEEHRRQLPGLLVLRGSHLLQQRGHAGRIPRVRLQQGFRFLNLGSTYCRQRRQDKKGRREGGVDWNIKQFRESTKCR